jgi:Flp pilus assembly protein TadD
VLGYARESRRDWAGAREQYLRALALDPADVAAATSLGRVEEGAGHWEEAERRYLAALAIQPGAAEATWRLAGLKIQRGDLPGGQALLAEAVPPSDAVTAVRVTALEADAGAGAEAAARLERVLADLALPVELAILASNILERGGRMAAATRVYEEALRKRPDEWQLQNGAAWALSQEGRDLDRALALAQSAVRGSKRDPIVLDTLASVHLARGEFDDARAVADAALPRAPVELRSHLYYLRAAALAGMGRRDAARDAMRSAIAAGFPENSIWLPAARTLADDLDADTSQPTSPP